MTAYVRVARLANSRNPLDCDFLELSPSKSPPWTSFMPACSGIASFRVPVGAPKQLRTRLALGRPSIRVRRAAVYEHRGDGDRRGQLGREVWVPRAGLAQAPVAELRA